MSGSVKPMGRLRAYMRRLMLILPALLLASCAASRSAATATPLPIVDIQSLTRALQRAAPRLEGPEAAPRLAPAAGVRFLVSGQEVFAYQFPDQASLAQALRELSSDGSWPVERAAPWKGAARLWTADRLLVAYPGSQGGVILLLSALLGDPLSLPRAGPDEPYPPAVAAALRALARELEVDAGEGDLLSYETALWPDSCLGLPQPDENCHEVETAGWRVRLGWDGRVYTLRTDRVGQLVHGEGLQPSAP